MPRPADDGRNADAAFVERAFETPQFPDAVKELVIHLIFDVRGSVVRAEDHDGVLREFEFVQKIEHLAHVLVEIRDHRGISGAGRIVWRVTAAFGPREGRIVPAEFQIGFEFLIGNVEGHMGNGRGIVQKERAVFVGADEVEGLFANAFRSVVLAFERVVTFGIVRIRTRGQSGMAGHGGLVVQGKDLVVIPERFGIVRVGDALAVVAEEAVDALLQAALPKIPARPSPICRRLR